MSVLGRLRWRRRWTIAIVGQETGRRVSLESIWRFRTQQEALARATEMNRRRQDDLTEYEPEPLARFSHRDRSGDNSRARGAASREG